MSGYIIDENYRLLYFDERTKFRYPDLKAGDLCHKVFSQSDHPCEGCGRYDPRKKKWRYYNKHCGLNLELEFCPMTGKDQEHCTLVLVEELDFCPVDEPEAAVCVPIGSDEEAIRRLDTLTGIFRYSAFTEYAGQMIRRYPEVRWCMMAIDIENFKLFNKWYGDLAGDQLLRSIGGYLNRLMRRHPQRCVAGYASGDNFYLMLEENEEQIRKVADDLSGFIANFGNALNFFTDIGVYRIDPSIPVWAMCDKARIALSKSEGNMQHRLVWFDEDMITQLEREQQLLSDIQRGIQAGEFTFYLQPQCSLQTGSIVGMEALVRWNHPTRGLVMPGEFITLLESSGLITDLDLYVWERVCICLKRNIDQGEMPRVPVSVNVSNRDFYTVDVPKELGSLLKKYDVPAHLLEVEITESAYAENEDLVKQVVRKLRRMGLKVLMDDFGSGYSALNMMKDINVDILKIDMRFLDLDTNRRRGLKVLQCIVRLAHLMQIQVIAEGVETQTQAELLLRMGCLYGQGYYFYRPLTMEQAAVLFAGGVPVDADGIRMRAIEHLNAESLFYDSVVGETTLNNILGPAVFLNLRRDGVYVEQANDQYCRLTGMTLTELEDSQMHFIDCICEKDRARLLTALEMAYANQTVGAEETLGIRRKDGSVLSVQMRFYFLREYKDSRQFFVSCAKEATP